VYLSRLLALALLLSQSALAVVVKLSDLHTMAKKSDIVVHGYVGDQSVSTDEFGRLITLTKIEVIDGLLGAKTGEIITIYQVGGEQKGLVMPLMGGQSYQFGQELIFFGLKQGSSFVSFGAGQGKLDISKHDGHDVVIEDLGDVSAVTGRGGSKNFHPSPLSFPDVKILKDEIRQMLKTRP